MKTKFTNLLALLVFVSTLGVAQQKAFAQDIAIEHYYSSVKGLKGEKLFKGLQRLLSNTHNNRGYKSLYVELGKVFKNEHGDLFDFYSNNPHGQSPYVYGSGDKCGTYKKEGDCWNREHIFPQGIFGKANPMKSDYFHIVPTDGYVNNRRGSLPFGEVGEVKWESQNGSKVGSNTAFGYQGRVFEPLDEYKGDIARALLYFAARYEGKGSRWKHATLNNQNYKFYKTWYVQLLVKWHKQDPVNDHERMRNGRGQKFQGNRNPFIDHPEWVEEIWND